MPMARLLRLNIATLHLPSTSPSMIGVITRSTQAIANQELQSHQPKKRLITFRDDVVWPGKWRPEPQGQQVAVPVHPHRGFELQPSTALNRLF